MMAISRDIYQLLEKEAEEREVSVQEFFRAVILADWAKKNARPAVEETIGKRL